MLFPPACRCLCSREAVRVRVCACIPAPPKRCLTSSNLREQPLFLCPVAYHRRRGPGPARTKPPLRACTAAPYIYRPRTHDILLPAPPLAPRAGARRALMRVSQAVQGPQSVIWPTLCALLDGLIRGSCAVWGGACGPLGRPRVCPLRLAAAGRAPGWPPGRHPGNSRAWGRRGLWGSRRPRNSPEASLVLHGRLEDQYTMLLDQVC